MFSLKSLPQEFYKKRPFLGHMRYWGLAIILLLVVLGSCKSTDALESSIATLNESNQDLLLENNGLEQKVDELELKIDQLQQEVDGLSEKGDKSDTTLQRTRKQSKSDIEQTRADVSKAFLKILSINKQEQYKEWKVESLGSFLVIMPEDLKKQFLQQSISYTEAFEGGAMSIFFDYGPSASDLTEFEDKPNYKKEFLVINGEEGIVVTVSSSEGHTKGVFFNTTDKHSRLSFLISYKSLTQRHDALNILKSIVFV